MCPLKMGYEVLKFHLKTSKLDPEVATTKMNIPYNIYLSVS
jgi:hypothetical protein